MTHDTTYHSYVSISLVHDTFLFKSSVSLFRILVWSRHLFGKLEKLDVNYLTTILIDVSYMTRPGSHTY